MKCRVLLIDDDIRFASSVVEYMELHDVDCDHCLGAEQVQQLLTANTYDVLVSDINMPRMSGFDLCSELRRIGIDLPMILISSRTALADKVKGFESGTDDYLIKPFELKELLMRVTALTKRKSGLSTSMVIEELELVIDFSKHKVTHSGIDIALSKSTWTLMAALGRAWPNPVKKEELEFLLWGDDVPDSDGLRVHIHHLRQRLEQASSKSILQTVRGYGFVLALSDD